MSHLNYKNEYSDMSVDLSLQSHSTVTHVVIVASMLFGELLACSKVNQAHAHHYHCHELYFYAQIMVSVYHPLEMVQVRAHLHERSYSPSVINLEVTSAVKSGVYYVTAICHDP